LDGDPLPNIKLRSKELEALAESLVAVITETPLEKLHTDTLRDRSVG
jgi:hypothetical protein